MVHYGIAIFVGNAVLLQSLLQWVSDFIVCVTLHGAWHGPL